MIITIVKILSIMLNLVSIMWKNFKKCRNKTMLETMSIFSSALSPLSLHALLVTKDEC